MRRMPLMTVASEPPPSTEKRAAAEHLHPPPRGRMAVLSMGRMKISPGESYDWTIHEGLWEIEVIERGTFDLGLAGKLGVARAGDVLVYPAGTSHAMWNRGSETGVSLVIHFEVNSVPLLQNNPLFRVTPGRPLSRLDRSERVWFEQLFHHIWWEETARQRGFEQAEDALLRMLFIGLDRHLAPHADGSRINPSPATEVMRFLGCVREALGKPDPLRIASQQMGINYDSLRHRFKRELSMSPRQYLTNLRLQRAKHLLLTTRLSVKEVAAQLGYSDAHHFTAAFTRHIGSAPLYWRKQPRLRTY